MVDLCCKVCGVMFAAGAHNWSDRHFSCCLPASLSARHFEAIMGDADRETTTTTTENDSRSCGRSRSSFSSLESYGSALLQTPRRFWQRACAVSTVTDQMTEVRKLKSCCCSTHLNMFLTFAAFAELSSVAKVAMDDRRRSATCWFSRVEWWWWWWCCCGPGFCFFLCRWKLDQELRWIAGCNGGTW